MFTYIQFCTYIEGNQICHLWALCKGHSPLLTFRRWLEIPIASLDGQFFWSNMDI